MAKKSRKNRHRNNRMPQARLERDAAGVEVTRHGNDRGTGERLARATRDGDGFVGSADNERGRDFTSR